MREYLLIIGKEKQSALGTVRNMPGLQVAENDEIYLRGITEAAMNEIVVKKLPVLHSYWLNDEDLFFPLNSLIPVGKLPPLSWIPLKQFIKPELPVSAMPITQVNPLRVQLVENSETRDGVALLTDLDTWKQYAEDAPATRLMHLKFAASEHGTVLIMGSPLPPIRGKEFYREYDILLPAGYAFEVPLVANLIHRKLNTNNDAALLFLPSGDWQRIPYVAFVNAKRSAVRLTVITRSV